MTTAILDKDFIESACDSEDEHLTRLLKNAADPTLPESEREKYLTQLIVDNSVYITTRLFALHMYNHLDSTRTIDLIRNLGNMYQLSGSKILEKLLIGICTQLTTVDGMVKLQVVQSLLSYEEEEDYDPDQEIDAQVLAHVQENNKHVILRNSTRKKQAYDTLDQVCKNMVNVPVPCQVALVTLLMNSADHKLEASEYFSDIVNNPEIECDYRYKCILSLESTMIGNMKKYMVKSITSTQITEIYKEYKKDIESFFTKEFKPNSENRKLFKLVLDNMTSNKIRSIYQKYFDIQDQVLNSFINVAMYSFLINRANMSYYRILAGQYLLVNTGNDNTITIENEIYHIALDKDLDYNRRADAADVLLGFGSPEMKVKAKELIKQLGIEGGKDIISASVFDNGQNVHTEAVDASVVEALEYLVTVPPLQHDGNPITYEYVCDQIHGMLNTRREERIKYLKSLDNQEFYQKCYYCENIKESKQNQPVFNTDECKNLYNRQEATRVALNRIYMDRARYSSYNNTLSSVLVKVWSVIMTNKYKDELIKRLLEELEEMAYTCSSGFISRLVNVLSGYTDYSIRISWEDQVVANFSGRLNAAISRIQNPNSIFYTNKARDVVKVWLLMDENKELFENLLKTHFRTTGLLYNIDHVCDLYLSTDRESKIKSCVEYFAEKVLAELTIPASYHCERKNFALFYGIVAPGIILEMEKEFSAYISRTDFDLYMRKALMRYEGYY